MIISFQTKTSDVLERFLENFREPSNIFMQLIHNIVFTEKQITRIDDIIIIEQESFLSIVGKYAMLPSATLIILGMLFQYFWMIYFGGVILLLSMIILSKYFLLSTIIIKLKFSGHKEKIEYVSDGFLLSKLLMEHKNGTTRSLRDTKK